MSFRIRYLILFLFFETVFPFSKLNAFEKTLTTLIVEPYQDGMDDEASQKTADMVSQKLQEQTPLYIVSPQKVDEVLSYYHNYKMPSEEENVEEAKNLLARAKEHYFQFAYVEAEAELQKAIQLAENRPETLVECFIVLGLVHAALKNKDEAIGDFQKVLTINPFYELDAKAFAPSVQKLFRQALGFLKEKPSGTIAIQADPKVAEVYLNGIYQGVSPLKLALLPAGSYVLSFKANNYQESSQSILLEGGQQLDLHPKLYWVGSQKEKSPKKGKEERIRRQIEEGLRIADLLKVDKVLFVDVDGSSIQARLLDRRYQASHRPLMIQRSPKVLEWGEDLERLAQLVFAQTELDLLKNPSAHLDPEGLGDPILLGSRRRKLPKGLLFSGLGAMGVGGLLAILLSGGSGRAPNTGTLAVSFK